MVMRAVADRFCSPFVWGLSDCCTAACDVFADLTGIDPMADLRGRYDSQRGAWAEIRARGGWRRMFTDLAAASGLRLHRPAVWGEGALGLARLPQQGHALVIGTPGGRWVGKIDQGFAEIAAERVMMSCHR